MLLELSVAIDRPIEQVFAFLRDIDEQRHGERVVKIEKVTPGPPQIGTQYREQIRMPFGRQGELVLEISQLDPPRRLSTTFEGPVMRGVIAYTLTPADNGTFLHQREEISYTRWAWPANYLARRALRAKVRKRLDGFKAQLEA